MFEIFRTAFDQHKKPMRVTVTVFPTDRNQFIVNVGDDSPTRGTKRPREYDEEPGTRPSHPGPPGIPRKPPAYQRRSASPGAAAHLARSFVSASLRPCRARQRLTSACPRTGKRRTSSWRALRNRSFRCYFVGSVTSDFGTWLQNTAQVLLAYRLSHSVLVVGLVTCAQFSSPLVLGPWAGVMTDKFGGRRILLATQLTAAAVAG